ncbi:nucleobase cation symporter-1 family protein [Aspergillus ruber CBS 135680]|uniref:NCS1 nucleoside transporter family protein n=1 Tax=Aspergillus ruber (strain CBS 135680) TaxID=1388766 RepID=A0A017SIH1_ASPRC|nr:NCS1 nucleoside transporter family protein [Aspergillus ruber CBS 135680]EYE96758.1 NCS1 nucleoside transporter family protein [Aspergillus ruber CBS 135680]
MKLDTILKRLEVDDEGGSIPNRWMNTDIKPVEAGRRTWGFWTFHNFWILINSNISTYMTGSSLIANGLTWWQAIVAIVVGNLLVVVFVVLNSLPGAYYHLGFPVVNRYVWGLYGSQFVLWNRILLSLVWYAFQAWIGGECIYVCLQAIWPSLETRIPNHMPPSTGMTTANFVSYIVFTVISLPMIYIKPHKLQIFFYVSAAIILIFEIVVLIWSLATMGERGFGDTMSDKNDGYSGWNIAFGIVSTIGGIAAGILNQNDYARFAKRPRDAILGQLISCPMYAIACSVIGILVTAATQERYGEALWNLPDLLGAVIRQGGSRSRTAAFFGGAALAISQIGVNVPGNALSGGFDLAATFPKYINLRRGAYITALLSVVCNPWKLVNTATTFLSVLSSYSVFLGPMIGIMIASYLVVHRRRIKVEDLFPMQSPRDSIYWYSYGVNWRAAIAWICGTTPSLPGFIASVNTSFTVPVGLTHLYYICFLTGFTISAAVYCILHYVFPVSEAQRFVDSAGPVKVLIRAYREEWDGGAEEVEGVVGVRDGKV